VVLLVHLRIVLSHLLLHLADLVAHHHLLHLADLVALLHLVVPRHLCMVLSHLLHLADLVARHHLLHLVLLLLNYLVAPNHLVYWLI